MARTGYCEGRLNTTTQLSKSSLNAQISTSFDSLHIRGVRKTIRIFTSTEKPPDGVSVSSFRAYLENGDPRFPLPTPLERWKFMASLSDAVRVWARSHHEDHQLSPWARAGGWKPEGIYCVCDNLFPLTRHDRKACSEKCAHVHRQREWRKRKESGATKRYDIAKELKSARKERKR
jgi:hypothetical protein